MNNDDVVYIIPDDEHLIDNQPQGQPSTPSDIKMHGLRTAYVNKEIVAGNASHVDNSGVIETLSMTLRVFYPLYDTADVFEYPEGTVVIVLSFFPNVAQKKVQLATLYTEDNGTRFDKLQQWPSSDVDFLIPISWNARQANEMNNNEVYRELLSKRNVLPRTILQNGMFYFFNASILFLYHTKRISLRAQDGIYMEIVLKAEKRMEHAFLPYDEEVYFMLLCYFLWVTESIHYPLNNDGLPNMLTLIHDLDPFLN